jgi:lipoyl-dependent peroxiredoxin
MADSSATTTWCGDLPSGRGTVEVASHTFEPFEVTWANRAERHGGTSAEELFAAAHSSCYSMALSNGLAKAGTPPEQLDTTATVTFVPGEGITHIKLSVKAKVPGLDAAGFQAAAETAKSGCPVSKALAAVPIDLEAQLT